MASQWKESRGLWQKMAPLRLRAACSLPLTIDPLTRGRIEICIGKLGAGKTTWAAQRARHLSRVTGRTLVTTGEDWPDPWRCVASFVELFELRNCVVLLDEIHLIAPGSRGLLDADTEKKVLKWFSLARKRGICVVGTTQAWTRVSTMIRQLVTTVWMCRPVQPRRIHMAIPFAVPEDGGNQMWPAQYFAPRDGAIPTNAGVWSPIVDDLDDLDFTQAGGAHLMREKSKGEHPRVGRRDVLSWEDIERNSA